MKVNKCNKLVCNLYDRKNYVAHIRSYSDMNTELRQQAKNNFEKDFLRLMNNPILGKNRLCCSYKVVKTSIRSWTNI